MEKQSSNVRRKVQIINPAYVETIRILKSGGREIVKGLYNSRQAQPSPEVKMVRKQLSSALESTKDTQELKHIQLLTEAIQDVIDLLELTRKDYHSKGLRQTREYAIALLEKGNEIIKKYKSGGMPMKK